MGIGGDELANTNVTAGQLKSFARFRAEQSSALTGLTFYYLGPPDPGYAAGTGGTMAVEVYADDGTVNHFPIGTALTSQALPARVAFSGEAGYQVAFSNPATLVAGTLYHIVWRNTDANPSANYFAVDYWFYRQLPNGAPDGRLAPKYPLTDWAHGYFNGTSWVLRTHFLPILDLAYANGIHQGQSYGEASYGSGQVGQVNGSQFMTRERITVSGGDKIISSLGVRLLKITGSTDPLTARIETGGTVIASLTISASVIPDGPPPTGGGAEDNIGVNGKWVAAAFSSPVTLINGITYYLRFSTGTAATYWMWVNRRLGAAYHYSPATYFSDGVAEKTTDGSTWTSLGRSANENDLQFYLVTP